MNNIRSWSLTLSTFGLATTIACDSPTSTPAPDPPLPVNVTDVSFTPNPLMVTAAVARVECSGPVAAVQVSYIGPGGSSSDYGSTPRFPVSACPADVNVLGLLASTHYATWTTVWGEGGDVHTVVGPDLTTDALPPDLPQVTTQVFAGPPVGLTAFTVFSGSQTPPGYALIVDSIGRVRWYLADLSAATIDLHPQPMGHYTLTRGTASFGELYDELDRDGTFLRRWTAVGGYLTDNHEFRFTPQRTGLLLGFDSRTMDLTAYGGSATAEVHGNILEEVDSLGQVHFLWNAFDHFSITDVDPSIPLTSSVIDWNHGNAIEIDSDGNYLVSFRHLSEITKIDSKSGNIVWRWGGVKNEFEFIDDALKFSFQHGIRRLANGNYILFDNGNTHDPPFSRAVEYRLNQTAKTATLAWSYRPSPDIFSAFVGFAQRLGNGNTLVTFGPQGTLHEVSPSGQLVWTLTVTLPPGNLVYRAYRIASLYDPGL